MNAADIYYDYLKRVLQVEPNAFYYKNSTGKVFIKDDKLYAEWRDDIILIDHYNMTYIFNSFISRRYLHCYDIETKKLLSCVDVFLQFNKECNHRAKLIKKYGADKIEFYILPTKKNIRLFNL